jgi:hypothetical protein
VGDFGEGQAGAVLSHGSVGGREDELVAQRPQQARVVHGAGGRVIDLWVAFSDVVIVVRRLAREGRTQLPLGATIPTTMSPNGGSS